MKFTVNKESGPLFKAGEQDEKGLPVVWAKAGEVVDIQVDSTDPKERTRASRWLRGQHGKISLYHSGEKPKGSVVPMVNRDMANAGVEKAKPKKGKG